MNSEFEVHMLNDTGIQHAKEIAINFNNLLEYLKDVCVSPREFAITKTKLEEASFFAKKSMASGPSNQKQP